MRRKGNISKKCMVCIMSAMMMMSSVTISMAFPAGVYAQDYETSEQVSPTGPNEEKYLEANDNLGEVLERDLIEQNKGTIEVNNGTVLYNYGEVKQNNSDVGTNYGNVRNLGTNASVGDNFGTVTGNGLVSNNYDGTVQGPTVSNQFYSVSIDSASDNATASYGEGFVSSGHDDDSQKYIQVTQDGQATNKKGTVIFKPNDGYEYSGEPVTDQEGKDSDGGEFTYSLAKQADRSYVVTISSLSGAIMLTPDVVNLLIQEIQEEEKVDISGVVIQGGSDNNNDGNNNLGSQSQENEVEKSIISMINEKMNTSAGAVDIDFKKDTYVTKAMLKALIKDNSKDVYCKFICDDVIYILRIPKGHKLTADIIESIFTKQKDTIGAGFLTIKELFANYGLQVEPEDNTQNRAVSIKSGASAQADAGIVRGREVYDPKMNTWNWLDANANGAMARDKEVWVPYIYQKEIDWYDDDEKLREIAAKSDPGMEELVYDAMKNKKGKWLRYDQNGNVLKGWVTIGGDLAELYPDEVGNTYYYDTVTGLMAKDVVNLNGVKYSFNEITGALEK